MVGAVRYMADHMEFARVVYWYCIFAPTVYLLWSTHYNLHTQCCTCVAHDLHRFLFGLTRFALNTFSYI